MIDQIMIDFDKLIEQHIHREMKPKKEGRYYPSEIGGCLRKIWYSYKQPKEVRMDLVRIFEVGNLFHDFMAEVLRSEKNPEIELLQSELPFELRTEEYVVAGRVDDVILVRSGERKILVEVKSTSLLKATGEASPQHAMQLHLYMHALGVHDGIILYIEKNTLKSKAFTVTYDEKIAKISMQRFDLLHKSLKQSKMPEPEARLKKEMGWMCKYCDWREECLAKTPDSELEKMK